MTTLLAGYPYNGGGLTTSTGHSPAAASSRILRTIAGTNRLHYEMAYGQTIAGSPQCSPSRPCGGVGHDHTGGMMGKAFVHSVFSVAFPPVTGGPDSGDYVLPPGLVVSASPAQFPVTTCEWRFPVPACPTTGGAYHKLGAGFSVYVSAIASPMTLEAVVQSSATGLGDDDGVAASLNLSATGYSSKSPVTVPFYAGTDNVMRLRLTTTDSVAVTMYLAAVHVSQTT